MVPVTCSNEHLFEPVPFLTHYALRIWREPSANSGLGAMRGYGPPLLLLLLGGKFFKGSILRLLKKKISGKRE